MKKNIILAMIIVLILILFFMLSSNKEIPEQPTEMSITYLDKPIIQKINIVCWKDCDRISKSEVLDLDSTEFVELEPNIIPSNSKLEFTVNGIHPDTSGYLAKTINTEGNVVRVYSTLLESETSSFIIPSPTESEYGDFKFVAKWYEKKKLQGQIEIMFRIEYKKN